MPDWEALCKKYPLRSYQEIWMEASRGCPRKRNGVGCSFCAIVPDINERDWKCRPLERISAELNLLARLGAKHIRFADDEFMAGQTIRALEFAATLKQLRKSLRAGGMDLPTFDLAMRVDDVYKRGPREARQRWKSGRRLISNNETRRLALIAFKEVGLTQVYLGLESGSLSQLKRMYKGVAPEDNKRAIEILRELGLQVAGGWIMIDPLMEGIEELKENIAFLEENRLIPERVEDDFVTNPIGAMRVLEGSPLVGIIRRQGLLGPKKENLIEYQFRYKDEAIAKIAHVLTRWEGEVAPFLYALKNRVALGVLCQQPHTQLEYLADYLFHLKGLDFEFLKEIVGIFDQSSSHVPSSVDLEAVIRKFRTKRTKEICRFAQDLVGGIVDDSAGTLKAGLQQIDSFAIQSSVDKQPQELVERRSFPLCAISNEASPETEASAPILVELLGDL